MKVVSSHVHRYKELEIVVSSQDIQGTGDKQAGGGTEWSHDSLFRVAGEMSNV